MPRSNEARGRIDVVQIVAPIARGHLMRSGILRSMLEARGLTVETFTGEGDGADFFEALTGARVNTLTPGYDLAYDGFHNLDMEATVRRVVRHSFSPARGLRDQASLLPAWSRARLVINDVHPAGLFLSLLPGLPGHGPRVLNVFSENALGSLIDACTSESRRTSGRLLAGLVHRMLERSDATIVNTIDPDRFFRGEGRTRYLPPLVQPRGTVRPSIRPPRERAGRSRTVLAYLNPHFRDRSIFERLIAASRAHDAFLYLVSEPAASALGDEPDVQIAGTDFGLRDLVRDVDAVVSGAGLALPLQCWVEGVPYVALLSDHPEHEANARKARTLGHVRTARSPHELADAIGWALDREPLPHPGLDARTRDAWLDIVGDLLGRDLHPDRDTVARAGSPDPLRHPSRSARPRRAG